MKISFTVRNFIFFLFYVNTFFAQDNAKKDTIFTFSRPIQLYGNNSDKLYTYDTVKNISAYKLNYLEPNFKYRLVSRSDSFVKIMPLNFKVYSNKRFKRRNRRFDFLNRGEIDKTLRSKLYNNKFFKINKSDFDKYAKEAISEVKELPDRMSVGLLTLPFKFRPQKETSFDTEFNLNTTLNVRLFNLYGNTSLYAQVGTGIGSVNLNSKNSSISADKPQDVTILSMHMGTMVQYKRVQAGLYLGVDHINNQTDYKWNHNGKIWLGFGVGYEIFKIGISPKKKNENTNE